MTMDSFHNLIGANGSPVSIQRPNINPSNTGTSSANTRAAIAASVDAAVDGLRAAFPGWAWASPQLRHGRVGGAPPASLPEGRVGSLLSRARALAEGRR